MDLNWWYWFTITLNAQGSDSKTLNLTSIKNVQIMAYQVGAVNY